MSRLTEKIDRNSAYNYWVPELADGSAVIVKAGYLVRAAVAKSDILHLAGDFNATTPIEVIGAPKALKKLTVNSKKVAIEVGKTGSWSGRVTYEAPRISLPNLSKLAWRSIDALPELQSTYDDSAWISADHKTTTNPSRKLTTPTSLYSSDYGFHSGALLYRGHFVATGKETTLRVTTQGGTAYGVSAWLNGVDLGSYPGTAAAGSYNATYALGSLTKGKSYVITMLIDNNGYSGNWWVGGDEMKAPFGILDYTFAGRSASDITWKMTGNLGGEDYIDKTRGPFNEGGLYPERQGWHQPKPPTSKWATSAPTTGISKAGVAFYTTSFKLELPKTFDTPLYFTFANSTATATATSTPAKYRVQLYVNGYQFGKYINHIGPETSFPVPQGILDYRGSNTVALTLWAHQPDGARIEGLQLTAGVPVLTALEGLELVSMPAYKKRKGAY